VPWPPAHELICCQAIVGSGPASILQVPVKMDGWMDG
jgi:hypothetical protein